MKITFPQFTLNADFLRNTGTSKYIFLLHGFTGSLNDWKEVADDFDERYNVAAIDLMGHGLSDSPEDVSFYSSAALVSQIHKTIKEFTLDKFVLLGYSMGGRAALSFAMHFPFLLEGLVLESSTPGLKTEDERNARILRDAEVIEQIKEKTPEEFIDHWMNLDIFGTQRRFSKDKQREIKDSKIFVNKTGFINSLKGFGAGVMPSYWNSLQNLNVKTLLITGDLDTKFTIINSEMADILPASEHQIIKHAGHNTHLEEPKQFITTVNNFLDSF